MGSSTAHWLARKTNGQLKVGATEAENNGSLYPLQDLKFHAYMHYAVRGFMKISGQFLCIILGTIELNLFRPKRNFCDLS